ncbi:hypothetical protein [Uliginosibacterium gangwonense]|uniref:hypothetical protein n=1 Tax=Uliginosibacterium gangwonense TaxID=392736 RepID=UPI0003762570|nr:hypothetical protein [Uliginosibacterium gangwonense]
MLIHLANSSVGNRAMASVLLLYYHLLKEGGFGHVVTAHVAPDDFNGFDFLDVRVAPNLGIDEKWLREGAVIYVLCELNDIVLEHDVSPLALQFIQKIAGLFKEGKLAAIPECGGVVEQVRADAMAFDLAAYQQVLAVIFERYVVGRMRAILPPQA